MTCKVMFKKLSENAKMPEYAKPGDSGADLFSSEDAEWLPVYSDMFGKNLIGYKAMIKTGISVELPEGFEMQIRPKSGVASKFNIIIPNTPGTVDNGYRGEVCVPVFCIGHIPNDPKFSPVIKKGTKIAQAVLSKYHQIPYEEVKSLTSTERGEGGFGSTGI